MIYIIHGEEPYLINKKVENIIANNGGEVKRFSTDKEDPQYLRVIDSCRSISLFSPTNVTILRDPDFLFKKNDGSDLTKFLAYCKDPVYESDLIIYSMDAKFDTRLSAYKEIAKNAEVILYSKYKKDEFTRYCYSRLNESDIKISKDAGPLLIDNCAGSVTVFENNLDLLILYPDFIDRAVIESLTSSVIEEKVFDFIDALTAQKLSLAYAKAQPLLDNSNLYGLISLLAGQLRFIYEVSYYRDKGCTSKEIMEKTGCKYAFRIDKAYAALSRLDRRKILTLLDRLAELEYESKQTSEIPDRLRFEMFVLNFRI